MFDIPFSTVDMRSGEEASQDPCDGEGIGAVVGGVVGIEREKKTDAYYYYGIGILKEE